MAAHLPSLRLPGIFISIPFAVGLITAASKMPGPLLGIILVVVLIPSLVTMFAAMAAYKCKRELFLGGASELDQRQPSAQVEFPSHNVYRSEEDLFVALDSRRPPEARVDYWIVSLGALLIAELTWVSALALSASTMVSLCALALGFRCSHRRPDTRTANTNQDLALR
jgi:hypothetical protein